MTYDTGYYTKDRHCHCCGKIIPANQEHYVHEKITGSGILDFHVCRDCHENVYTKIRRQFNPFHDLSSDIYRQVKEPQDETR